MGYNERIAAMTDKTFGWSVSRTFSREEAEELAHYAHFFSPFSFRKMMYSEEIDICHAVLNKTELDEKQKETAAKLIAEGYLKRDEAGEVTCAVPVFATEQYQMA